MLGHRIKQPHADLNGKNGPKSDLFRISSSQRFGSELTEEQHHDGQENRVHGQGEIHKLRPTNKTGNNCGRNGGGANIGEIVSEKKRRQQPVGCLQPCGQLLGGLVALRC